MARHATLLFALPPLPRRGAPTPAPPPPAPQVAPSAPPIPSGSPPSTDAAAGTTRMALLHVTVVDPSNGAKTADRAVVFDGDRIDAVVASDALPATPPTRT